MSLLRQPYPVSEKSPRRIFLTGLLAGGFIALFLIVFQPFGTDDFAFVYKNWFLAGYGAIVAVVIWLATLVPLNFFDGERWTVGKQIVLMLVSCLVGITISYFYVHLLGGTPQWRTYGLFVGNALTVAIFPVVGVTLTDYLFKLNRYQKGAEAFNARPFSAPPTSPRTPSTGFGDHGGPGSEIVAETNTTDGPSFALLDEQQRPVLTLPAGRIWCLRSDRNYVDVFHFGPDGTPMTTTVRNTLTKVSAGLPPGFLRPHRSYFVRAAAVETVTGNAQGYRLHHPDFPGIPVPVSRGKSSEILGFIRG